MTLYPGIRSGYPGIRSGTDSSTVFCGACQKMEKLEKEFCVIEAVMFTGGKRWLERSWSVSAGARECNRRLCSII